MKDILQITLLVIMSLISGMALADYKAGEAKSQVCASCHGINGNSEITMYPKLAGQYKDYLYHSLKSYQNGKRKNGIMVGIASTLNDQQIEKLSNYFSSQVGLQKINQGINAVKD